MLEQPLSHGLGRPVLGTDEQGEFMVRLPGSAGAIRNRASSFCYHTGKLPSDKARMRSPVMHPFGTSRLTADAAASRNRGRRTRMEAQE